MTLKCVAADGAYDRAAASWRPGNQQCRFSHTVERIHGARVESIRTEGRGEPFDGVRSYRLGAVECEFPA